MSHRNSELLKVLSHFFSDSSNTLMEFKKPGKILIFYLIAKAY